MLFTMLFAMSLDSIFIEYNVHNALLDSALNVYLKSSSPYTADYTIAGYMLEILMDKDSVRREHISDILYKNYMGECSENTIGDDALSVLSIFCNVRKQHVKVAEAILKSVDRRPYMCWGRYFLGTYYLKADIKKATEYLDKVILDCPDYTVALWARNAIGEYGNGE